MKFRFRLASFRKPAIVLAAAFAIALLSLPREQVAEAGKGATYSNDLLKLIFNATAIANIADNAATSPLTNLFVALHTADPTSAGTQSSSEIAYTSYARVSVARTTGGFTVTTNSVSPAATVSFPAGTGGSGTATFWSVGVASSGATKILYSGAISPSIACGSGVTPQLTTASTVTEAALMKDHRDRLLAPTSTPADAFTVVAARDHAPVMGRRRKAA